MNRLIYLLPVITLLFLGGMQYYKQAYPEKPQLITRLTPDFDLKEVLPYGGETQNRLTNADLPKQPVLINIFASWCSTCIMEHGNLLTLSRKYNIPIYGLAYRDKEEDVRRFVGNANTNPYRRIAIDTGGGELLKWNFNGVPQTYIIDAQGRTRFHLDRRIRPQDIKNIILPLMEQIKD